MEREDEASGDEVEVSRSSHVWRSMHTAHIDVEQKDSGEHAGAAQETKSTLNDAARPSGGEADRALTTWFADEPTRRSLRDHAVFTFRCFGGSALGIAILFASFQLRSNALLFVGFGLATILGLVGTLSGFRYRRRVAELRQGETSPVVASAVTVVSVVFAVLLAFFGALAAFAVTFTRGRQIRRFGRVLLPRVVRGDAWARADEKLALGDALTAPGAPSASALAAQWRENARTEHASVAAFARLTLDLMALGAPPALVASANRDSLDEIRHAEMCFGLARAIDGEARGPAPFPEARAGGRVGLPRPLALASLAVESLVDGALHEGVSARIIAQLARRSSVAPIRAMLKSIAADEGRHAAHGWDVVVWCLDEGGVPVANALLGALRSLPLEMRSPLPEGAGDGSWEAWGIHGHALEADEYRKQRAALVERVERLTAPALSGATRAAA